MIDASINILIQTFRNLFKSIHLFRVPNQDRSLPVIFQLRFTYDKTCEITFPDFGRIVLRSEVDRNLWKKCP